MACVCFGAIFTASIVFNVLYSNDFVGNIERDNVGVAALAPPKDDPVFALLTTISNGDDFSAPLADLASNEKVPAPIKKYFKALEHFTVSGGEPHTINFVRSAVLCEYYKKLPRDTMLSLAAITPYYLIKTYDYFDVRQETRAPIYSDYIRYFVNGRPSLDIHGCNVFCLYVYATYCNRAGVPVETYKNLLAQIEAFIFDHKERLGDGGDMAIQRTYLLQASAAIKSFIHDKTAPLGSVRVWWHSVTFKDVLPPFPYNAL